MSAWEEISEDELRIAAKVARASGGVIMAGAASAWELRADLLKEQRYSDQLMMWITG